MKSAVIVATLMSALAGCNPPKCRAIGDYQIEIACCVTEEHMGWPSRREKKYCEGPLFREAVSQLRAEAEAVRGKSKWDRQPICDVAVQMVRSNVAVEARPWVMDICCKNDEFDFCWAKPPWPQEPYQN